ncbi:MAG: hypothetical protein LC118_05035 [Dehalococcoidia bacterium]|nr:hypothetical protein [Dehalococcoidia bacterium]
MSNIDGVRYAPSDVPASDAALAAEILGRILSQGATVSPYKFLLLVSMAPGGAALAG